MRGIQRWRLFAAGEGVALAAGALIGLWLIGTAAAESEDAQEPASQEGEQGDDVSWEEKPYIVVDGKVDFGTYNGYRRYHATCHVCHGPAGLGSSIAPALVESIPRIGYETYVETVINGRQNVSGTQQSVMPPFGEDPNVVEHVDDIYAYLKARADGEIGRGRPERIDPEQDPVWQERRG